MALKIYRFISFVLLPVALLFAFFTLFAVLVALANPTFLLPVFLLACIVIYIVATFIFLNKGITQAQRCKPILKDWIKVNAYVSIFFVAISLIQSVGLLLKPELMDQVYQQALAMQKNGTSLPKEMIQQIFKGTLYFLLTISSLLFIHIILTFRFLKEFASTFH